MAIRATGQETLLYWIVLGFAGGVVINELARDSITGRALFFYVIIAIAVATAVFFAVFPKNTVVILIFVVFCSTGAGFLRNYITVSLDERPTALDQFIGQEISFDGVLTEEQERRDFNTRLTVQVKEVNGERISPRASSKTKILVTTGNPRDFRYGDVVRVKGELVLPENFYTDTGREFDYVGYLRANDIHFLVKNASKIYYSNGFDAENQDVEFLSLHN